MAIMTRISDVFNGIATISVDLPGALIRLSGYSDPKFSLPICVILFVFRPKARSPIVGDSYNNGLQRTTRMSLEMIKA